MTTTAEKPESWRDTILAGLANYIDAGSIVSGSAALALWQAHYGLSNDLLGLIGAFGPNAIGAGIGALVGGWLCDKVGRKKIYQWDMLVYAVGMAMLVFASAPWMIIIGFLIVGLAVGGRFGGQSHLGEAHGVGLRLKATGIDPLVAGVDEDADQVGGLAFLSETVVVLAPLALAHGTLLAGQYRTPAIYVEVDGVFTNTAPCGSIAKVFAFISSPLPPGRLRLRNGQCGSMSSSVEKYCAPCSSSGGSGRPTGLRR